MNILRVLVYSIIYPYNYIKEVLADMNNRSNYEDRHLIKVVLLRTCILASWFCILLLVSNMLSDVKKSKIDVVPVSVIKDTFINIDKDSMTPSTEICKSSVDSYGEDIGKIKYKEETYNINFEQLGDKKEIVLPSGIYQSGNTRQRAEMIMIINQICTRKEISVTQEELMGLLFISERGNLEPEGSLVWLSWKERYNENLCGGPFSHNKNDWEGQGEDRGKIFISTLENHDLKEEERVVPEYSGSKYKTPDGLARPSMFFFSDAAYTAAFRLSQYKKGLDSEKENSEFSNEKVIKWAKERELSSEVIEQAVIVNCIYYYFRHEIKIKDWYIPFYIDNILDKKSTLLVNSKDVVSSNITDNFENSISNTKRKLVSVGGSKEELTNYKQCYIESNKEKSIMLPYKFFGGSEWIYGGLGILASQMCQVYTDTNIGFNLENSAINSSIGEKNFLNLVEEGNLYLGVPYSLPGDEGFLPPPEQFNCSWFINYIYSRTDVCEMPLTSAQDIYTSYCTNVEKGKEKPGDLIFFDGTYENGRTITHVGLVVGEGIMLQTGGNPKGVCYVSYLSRFWDKHFYSIGRVNIE